MIYGRTMGNEADVLILEMKAWFSKKEKEILSVINW